jgi:hypothetical protein
MAGTHEGHISNPHSKPEANMTAFSISHALLWTLLVLLKSTFLGGWFVARWLAWLLSPVWVTAAALGAASGIFTSK